jgi:hypothetical protein
MVLAMSNSTLLGNLFFLSPSHQFMNQVLDYQLKLSSHFYPSINVVVRFEELFFAILFGHDFVLFSV